MGCCCCCCKDNSIDIVNEEATKQNPLAPYHDWVEKTRQDIGKSDFLSVSRDFPRIHTVVDEFALYKGGPPSDFAFRNEKLQKTLCEIARINGENELEGKIREKWNVFVPSAESDCSGSLNALFKECGLIAVESAMPSADADASTEEVGRETEASQERNVTDAAAAPTGSVKEKFVANSLTFKVLQYLTQGTLFFSSQRIRFLLWVPWSERLQDVDWVARVYKRKNFEEYVYIAHEQVLRNVVPEEDRKHIPSFMVRYIFNVTLSSETGDWVDASVAVQQVIVKKVSCSSKLWLRRYQHLSDLVFNMWNVEVELQDELPIRSQR